MAMTNEDHKSRHSARRVWMKVLDEMESLHLERASPESWSCGEGFCTNPEIIVGPWGHSNVNSSIPGAQSLHIFSITCIFFMSRNRCVIVLFKAFDGRLQDTAWGCKTNSSSLLHGCYLIFKNEYLPHCADAASLGHKQALCYLGRWWTCTCFSQSCKKSMSREELQFFTWSIHVSPDMVKASGKW